MSWQAILSDIFLFTGFVALTGLLAYFAVEIWYKAWNRYKNVRLSRRFIIENWDYIAEWFAKQEGVKKND